MASADEKNALSMDFLYRAVYPDTDLSHVSNTTKPDCLKLVAIVQKCKFGIAENAADNVVNKDEGNAFDMSFMRAKIGEFERQYQEENPPPPISQMAGYGKGRLGKCKQNL